LVLTAAGVGLGAWWAHDNLGRAWGWDPLEVGGMSVLIWYGLMMLCLLRRQSDGRAEMLLGVAGNAVVSLSWFGAGMLAARRTYGFTLSWAVCLLIGFVLLQVVMACLALAPVGSTGWRIKGRKS
jgi:hypothetical protein